MDIRRVYLIIFFVFPIVSPCFCQNFVDKYNAYFENNIPDYIHLQLDKDVYLPGEDIWFKAYIQCDYFFKNKSTNLYIDWISYEDKVVSHQIFPISSSGISSGVFNIPKTLNGSKLLMRVYTKWSLNFDESLLYHKYISIIHFKNLLHNSINTEVVGSKRIVNDSSKISRTNDTTDNNVDITFLPEGGQLVSNIESKVAFIAKDSRGIPKDVSGWIEDSLGNHIADFTSKHDGMGSFSIIPEMHETYTAVCKDNKGKFFFSKLPEVLREGIVLGITDAGKNKRYTVQRSGHTTTRFNKLHMIATMRHKAIYAANIDLSASDEISGTIPVDGLPMGIMVITVFDEKWSPLSERICFVNNNDNSKFKVLLSWEKKDLGHRGLNQFLINVTDSIPANMSIAITDNSLAIDSLNNANIFTDFLLTPEIRGLVYSPNYYFSDTSSQVRRDLDLVMLTHGWRKYNWEQITKGNIPAQKYPRDSFYFTLSGRILDKLKEEKDGGQSIFFIVKEKDSVSRTQFITINKDASFKDPNFLLFDSSMIYYRIKGMRRFAKIEINQPNFMQSPSLHKFNDPLDYTILNETSDSLPNIIIKEMGDVHELEAISVESKTKNWIAKMDEEYVNNPLLKGNGTSTMFAFNVKEDKSAIAFLSVFDYLKAQLAGYTPTYWNYSGYSLDSGGLLMYYLDETPISAGMAADQLATISMSNIAYIKAFPAPFAGSPLNGAAIAIYTKRGKDDMVTISDNLPAVLVKGYTPLKEFYLPNYKAIDSTISKPDYRSTIYWNPILMTNKDANKIRIGFYNNDISTGFRVVLEGINAEGKLLHYEQIVNP